jgi:hypothetical protein
MNESCAKSRYDRLLFTFLFVSIGSVERYSHETFCGPWCAIVVDLQTFEKQTNETFDDARWILTMTWVAPEYRDTVGLASLCRGTWLMRILTKATKEYMKRGTRHGSSLPTLCSMRRVAPCH